MKRLLILNWRDSWHPRAGGAELVTRRLAEGMTQRGWDVEWFSALYPGAAHEETREGVRYIRAGSNLTVHLHAFRRYRKRVKEFTRIVDEINTIPFYTSLYARDRSVALIHQLARDVWQHEAPWPIGNLGALLEPLYLMPYRRARTMTISPSSAETLRQVGFRGSIFIIPMAVDEPADEQMPEKQADGDIIVVSRLTPSKRISHALHAANILKKSGWAGTLHIVGAGDRRYVGKLERLAAKLDLRNVRFHGRVSEGERARLLRSASLLWLTSVREGWGLVVTEAARHWTPSVVYRVPGLVDSVVDGVTGSVVEPRPAALAEASRRLLQESLREVAAEAVAHSYRFSWQRTVDAFEDALGVN